MVPRGVEGGLIGIVGSVGAFDDVRGLGILEGGVWREDCSEAIAPPPGPAFVLSV